MSKMALGQPGGIVRATSTPCVAQNFFRREGTKIARDEIPGIPHHQGHSHPVGRRECLNLTYASIAFDTTPHTLAHQVDLVRRRNNIGVVNARRKRSVSKA